MTFPWTIDRRVAALAIFSGCVAVAFVGQNAAISRAAPVRGDLPPVLASRPQVQATAEVPPAGPLPDTQVATTTNACETQNWPYYSKRCLHGEGATQAPRQIHLQPASTTPTASAPVTVALADTAARKSSEPRRVSETPPSPQGATDAPICEPAGTACVPDAAPGVRRIRPSPGF